jgi:glycosyltransferase involved in cell wall biosynthesis
MIRLAIVSHHGGPPAGAEHALMLLLDHTRGLVEPVFFVFQDGEFTRLVRRRYGNVAVVAMSPRVAASTRYALRWGAIADTLALSLRLAGALRAAGVDVVLTNTMKAHLVGSIAARLAGTPTVNYLHDMLEGTPRRMIRETSRLLANARFACSSAAAENLRLPRTTVIHPPIDTEAFRGLAPRGAARIALGLPDDGLAVVGLVGRILRWKGQDRFIRIAARVLGAVDAHFAIVGAPVFACDAAYPGELREQVAEQRLEDRVHFVPWQDDPARIYAALDVSCNCSIREPFGRTTVEALACGVPAVCFDDAGVCEVFAGNAGARAVPAGDESAFADELIELLGDRETLTRASALARDVAARLDAVHAARTFLAAIEPLAGVHR